MIANITQVKEEKIHRSKEVVAELKKAGITAERRKELEMQLESLTGDVLFPMRQEILEDINSLDKLLRGNFISKREETYFVEVDNMAQIERYGWELTIVNGKKMIYDPAKDPDQRKMEPVPKMTIEKMRTLYDVSTNKDAIRKIEELLQAFLERVRTEFKHTPIDEILEQKRLCELEISKIDRSVMTKETMGEADFLDASWLKNRPIDRLNAVGPDAALFAKFDSLKAGSAG